MILGIDASRNRSGGARAHVIGILTDGDPRQHGIQVVHLWAPRSLLDSVPDQTWLVKHSPKELEESLLHQVWWQATRLSLEIAKNGCDILFTTDASTFCRFSPTVVLSQDMLSYEPGVMRSFGYTKARLRLLLILLIQNRAFRFAHGVIFLTQYASKIIQLSCGPLQRIVHIPHGVGEEFKRAERPQGWPSAGERPIRCVYVSNAEMYKHQWVVVCAIAALRKRGHNIALTLVGGGAGRAQRILDAQRAASDPDGSFVEQIDFVSQAELLKHLISADLFVFASSCENMPVTLVEAMAVGLPIACSIRGPMPEVLQDGGVYFNPEDAESIAGAVEQIVKDPALRLKIAGRAKTVSEQYSWLRCSDETWRFIVETYNSLNR
ncbi:MAG: glycosyltransferase [Burkholderiales bacterium]|nr:glycosyltransferase [Burkholderiales bacterium]